jgi:hypothetical protein
VWATVRWQDDNCEEVNKMGRNGDKPGMRTLINLTYFVAFALMWFFRTREYPTDLGSLSTSVGLLAIGGLIWIAARVTLGRAHSTVNVIKLRTGKAKIEK